MKLARLIGTALDRVPRGFLGMVALILLGEFLVDRNDLRFSSVEADTWRGARRSVERLQSGGILLMGDSQVELGISPLTLGAKLGRPARCVAVPGGQPPSTYFLLRKAIESGARPSAVVVDFEPHLLKADRDPGRRNWTEMAGVREDLELAMSLGDADAFASMALEGFLPSYRERLQIRSEVMDALRGQSSTKLPDRMLMARRNRKANRGAILLGKQSPGTQHDYAQWANPSPEPWKPHPINEEYAHRFLALAQANKIPTYCVLMPVVPGLHRKAVVTGMEPAYFAWLRQLQGQYPGLVVLDYRNSGYPDSAFTDSLHLDVEGAASAALALADVLAARSPGDGLDRWVAMPGFRLDGSQSTLEDHFRSDVAIRDSSGKVRR